MTNHEGLAGARQLAGAELQREPVELGDFQIRGRQELNVFQIFKARACLVLVIQKKNKQGWLFHPASANRPRQGENLVQVVKR